MSISYSTGIQPTGWTKIATVTLTVAGTDFHFATIPSGYTNLRICGKLKCINLGEQLKIKFNTASVTDSHYLVGSAVVSSTGSGDGSNNFGGSGATANTWVIVDSLITNGSTMPKIYHSVTGSYEFTEIFTGWYNSNTEISDIVVQSRFANCDVGSTLELWGEK